MQPLDWNSERRVIEAPSSNIQAPEKHQVPNREGLLPCGGSERMDCGLGGPQWAPLLALDVGVWNFSGAWSLDVGALASSCGASLTHNRGTCMPEQTRHYDSASRRLQQTNQSDFAPGWSRQFNLRKNCYEFN
jgi:hypothetical protein